MAEKPKIRAIVVDDEAPARARIRQLLKDEPDFEIVAECSNGREAVSVTLETNPDLVFLDVQMPRLSGLDVCDTLSSASALPGIIFVTAYDEHALKAFELHAIDYLLKPFDRERFQRALNHAREQLSTGKRVAADLKMEAFLEDLRSGYYKNERLVFKENGRVIFVRSEAVDWIEADGNYMRIHAGDDSYYIRGTLARLEAQLPASRFMRISRSVLVNLDRIKELQPLFYGDYSVILQDGSRLTMSRNYRDRIETLIGGNS